MQRLFLALLALSLWMSNMPIGHAFAAPQAVVHAVLFYSPNCGHCHYVIEEVLPPLVKKYGAQLQIIGVDVTQPQGSAYFESAVKKFNLESSGVPFLVIGNEYLVGSVDIPEKLPSLIEKYLAQGGVDFPDIPGLREEYSAAITAQAPTPADITETNQNQAVEPLETGAPDSFSVDKQILGSPWELVARDPLGNGLAIIILVAMISIGVFSVLNFQNPPIKSSDPWPIWLIPVLSLAGFFVAGYLAYVETAQVAAVCGPVGDCNTVQQSEYARLFGFLPIGVMGLLGYVGIMVAWLVGKLSHKPLSQYADLALLIMTTFGLAFSIYLTFLEPFVIGATCAWCLTSALIMTALFWLSQQQGKRAGTILISTPGSKLNV